MPETINGTLDLLPVYVDAFRYKGEYCVLVGGAGSGKSWFTAQKFVARAMLNPNERFLLVRKVGKTCHGSVYQQIKDVMIAGGFQDAARFRDSTSDIFFHNGSAMYTVGLDDPEKIKSIAGITSVWVEEASELTEPEFNELDRRIRGDDPPSYFQLCLTLNPVPTGRWIKNMFVDQGVAGAYVLTTTARDNSKRGPKYDAKLSRIRDDSERAIYERGEWAQFTEGLIYTDWSTGQFPDTEDVFWGVDFGYEHPAVAVICHVRDVEDGPYLHVHEAVYEAGLSNAVLSERIKQSGYKGSPVYCDSAEPKSIQDLRDNGINALKSDKAVAEGIKRVREHKLVFTPSSVNLHREASMYRRMPDTSRYSDGETFKEEPIKQNDHGMDAIRYAVFSREKHWYVYD